MTPSGSQPSRNKDEVIGVAFGRSLFVVGGVGIVVGGVLLARTLLDVEEQRVADETRVEAPTIARRRRNGRRRTPHKTA